MYSGRRKRGQTGFQARSAAKRKVNRRLSKRTSKATLRGGD